jgi:F-type H+-transporting ATPase subunit b
MEFNGTFFAAIISFLVFVFVMNKILYEPVRKIVNERNNFIEGNYNSASENNAKADELSQKREEEISGAKEDARIKYNDILTGFKDKRTDIVKDAQTKSHDELEQAYQNLNNVSNDAKENLKHRMTDLANDIVEKVLGYRSEVQSFDNDKVNEILYQNND